MRWAPWLLAVCACQATEDRASPARHVSVVLQMTPLLDQEIAVHARTARLLGLVPLVELETPWNSGAFFGKNLDAPEVVSALDGVYLVRVAYDERCIDDAGCATRWGSEELCGSFAQTWLAVGPEGEPSSPTASPGKDGPRTPAAIATMIRGFKDLVARATPDASPRCAPI